MKTSTQLNAAGFCPISSKMTEVTSSPQAVLRAAAQKDIIKRALNGEHFNGFADIRGELDSVMTAKKVRFENYNQRKSALDLYALRLTRYIDYIQNRLQNIILLSDEDKIVRMPDGRGQEEEVKVYADYYVYHPQDNFVQVVRVKTGRASNFNNDKKSNETLALARLGKKLAEKIQRERILNTEPGVGVVYHYLGENDARAEKNAYEAHRPYEYQSTKIKEVPFDTKSFAKYEERYAQTQADGSHCNPADCAACANYNICHFEEPPISIGCEREIRPLSDVRLSSVQREIVEFEEGTARVLAGPGSGKTLVTSLRIKRLIEKGTDPKKICAITFTKTGAQEVSERVIRYLASDEGLLVDPAEITSTTINAFCQMILDIYYERLGFTQKQRICPEEVESGIVNRILDAYPQIPEWKYGFTSSGQYQSFIKNALTSAKEIFADIKENGYTPLENPYKDRLSQTSIILIFQMYEEYRAQFRARNLISYADQLNLVFELLRVHPTLFEELGYEHIIVDEMQDTQRKEIDLINCLRDTTCYKSFMGVGDDSQSIFAFRGTTPYYITHFEEFFGAFTDFRLLENHRSTSNIIDNANKINATITDRADKDLIATNDAGANVSVQGFYSAKSEYGWIAHDIADRIARGEDPRSIAFLGSDRYELTEVANALTKLGVPSILMNPIPFKQNSRVVAICDFYDSFRNGTTKGMLEYANVLEHGGLKDASEEQVNHAIQNQRQILQNTALTVENFVELAKGLDLACMDECYQEFLEKISYCRTIEEMDEFFEDFELYGNSSMFKREGHYNGVCLITVHSAKGMEWDTTYLSLSKFDKPMYHTAPNRYSKEINEVRRKWFVGATRAKHNLICTGQYILKHTSKDGVVLNNFLREAYDLVGLVYGYNASSYLAQKQLEAQEAMQQRLAEEQEERGA